MKFSEAKAGMEVYTVANGLGKIINVDENEVVVEFNMIDREGHNIIKRFNKRQISTLFERPKVGDIVQIIYKENNGFLRKGDIGIITLDTYAYSHDVFFRHFVLSTVRGSDPNPIAQTLVQKITKKLTDEQNNLLLFKLLKKFLCIKKPW
jgi:hypothetical protein